MYLVFILSNVYELSNEDILTTIVASVVSYRIWNTMLTS